MTNTDLIKSLLKSGDVVGAETMCRKALEKDQDNAVVKMLYATCRNLQGDEETFRRIMLEIAPQMEAMAKADPDCEAAKLWRKSGAVLMEYVVLGVLVVAAVMGTVVVFGDKIRDSYNTMKAATCTKTIYTLYDGPVNMDLTVEPAGTNIVELASTNNVVRTVGTPEQPSQPERVTP